MGTPEGNYTYGKFQRFALSPGSTKADSCGLNILIWAMSIHKGQLKQDLNSTSEQKLSGENIGILCFFVFKVLNQIKTKLMPHILYLYITFY